MIGEYTGRTMAATQLDSLWQAMEWKPRGAARWQEVLSKSSHVYTLWDDQRLVGIGRIIEDGVMCMFYDIAVHPDYQRQGLGTRIMEHLIGRVKDKGYVSIGLFAWEGNPANVPFYERFGFVPSKGMELTKYMKRE